MYVYRRRNDLDSISDTGLKEWTHSRSMAGCRKMWLNQALSDLLSYPVFLSSVLLTFAKVNSRLLGFLRQAAFRDHRNHQQNYWNNYAQPLPNSERFDSFWKPQCYAPAPIVRRH